MINRATKQRAPRSFRRVLLAAIAAGTGLGFLSAGATPAHGAEEVTEEAVATVAGELPSGIDLWDITLSVGFDLVQGNKDSFLLTSRLRAERKTEDSEIRLEAAFDQGETDGRTDTDEYGASAQYNRFLSDRLYAGVIGSYLHDNLGDLDYRIRLAPILGYYVVKRENLQLALEAGPGHVWEKEAGVTDNYFNLRLAERLTWQIGKRSKLWQSLEFLPEIDDFDNFELLAEIGFATQLTKRLSFETAIANSYDNRVAAGVAKNDTRITASLAYALGKASEIETVDSSSDAAGALPAPGWKTSASLGLSLLRGNSDNLRTNVEITTAREFDRHLVSLHAGGAYGESDSTTNVSNVFADADYKRLCENERFYLGANLAFLHDDIAEVDYRITPAATFGYFFIQNDKTKLNADIGPGYVIEKVEGVSDSYAALRIGQEFEHFFSERVRVWESVVYLPKFSDFGDYIIDAEVGIEAKINDHLSFKTYVQDRYDAVPARGNKSNELTLVSALSLKL